MNENEHLDLIIKSNRAQIDATHDAINRHLDESERIHARDASQTIVNIAKVLATDPTN